MEMLLDITDGTLYRLMLIPSLQLSVIRTNNQQQQLLKADVTRELLNLFRAPAAMPDGFQQQCAL
ncbi:hypothetical protein D3C75_1046860 [compost metagenome]